DPPAVLRIARLSASAVMFGISYWLIWRRGKIAASPQGDGGATPRDLLEFLLVLTLALITSPLSWTHYYVSLLICARARPAFSNRSTIRARSFPTPISRASHA